jgi:yecA family protein
MAEQLPPLNDQDRQTLKDFLSHSDRPNGTLNYKQFIGLLYGVLSAPEFLSTDQWLPMIFNGESANAEKQTEMEKIILILIQHYKEAFDDLMSGTCNPPLDLQWHEEPTTRMDLEFFCQGFITAFTNIEPLWKGAIEQFDQLDESFRGDLNLADHIYAILGLISTLAAPDLNIERAENAELLKESLPEFAQQLPEAVYSLAQMGGKLEELFSELEQLSEEQTDTEHSG